MEPACLEVFLGCGKLSKGSGSQDGRLFEKPLDLPCLMVFGRQDGCWLHQIWGVFEGGSFSTCPWKTTPWASLNCGRIINPEGLLGKQGWGLLIRCDKILISRCWRFAGGNTAFFSWHLIYIYMYVYHEGRILLSCRILSFPLPPISSCLWIQVTSTGGSIPQLPSM